MKFLLSVLILGLVLPTMAGWWIFGSDEEESPRLSELMEPASLLIDEASDLAGDGKVTEAVQKYREAVQELDLVESRYPQFMDKPEFATIKTKRAFVNAAIDSILLNQARQNAKVVATSDTTELEKRYREERERMAQAKVAPAPAPAPVAPVEQAVEPDAKEDAKMSAKPPVALPANATPRERAIAAIGARDFAKADAIIAEMLAQNPKSILGLNLRATKEAMQGRLKEAEATLDQVIESNPRDYHAYYNMAQLYLQTRKDGRAAALRYYETGRLFGGPADPELEAACK